MLQPILHQLKNQRIVLASGSPRRHEILRNIGLNVEICSSLFEENLDIKQFKTFPEFVEETAMQKVLEVSQRLESIKTSDKKPIDIIIGADTIVTLNDRMFGKPKTPEKAFEYLSELAGKKHVVYTGVVIKAKDHFIKFTENVTVQVGKLTPTQIQAYVDTGEPLDKAGGYGIQGVGGTIVERIDGDFFTVMGLPLFRLTQELSNIYKDCIH